MRAAVKANEIAAADPNMAAFHQRGPPPDGTTATTMAALAKLPTKIQSRLLGTSFPPPGLENTRKPESPKAMAEAPIHSRRVILYPKYVPNMKTRHNNSIVSSGGDHDVP